MKHDVVYILRNNISSDEVKYSLRSVEANFPCNKVWIYGGKPDGIEPDEFVAFQQKGLDRYVKVTGTIREICSNDDITESFWLFNDDFFILRPAEGSGIHMANGSIRYRIQEIERRHGHKSKYANRLERVGEILHRRGYDSLCYAIHVPMLINRQKALEVLDKFKEESMFRCLYGNYVKEPTIITPDVKVFGDGDPLKDGTYMSTDDAAWNSKAGRYIRRKFSTPSRWEV